MKQRAKKHFITLNFKLTLMVVIALIMTFLVYEILQWVTSFTAQKYYLSEEAVKRNVDSAYNDLMQYIDRYDVKSTDIEQFQKWVKDHEYTYLMVSDNYSIYFDGGWSTTSAAAATGEDVADDQTNINYDSDQERISPAKFKQDTKNRIIDLRDGPYYVYLSVYREQNFYRIMNMVKIILCVLTLIGILIIYNGKVLRRVTRLSEEVEEVTSGNLTADIKSTANDEIGRLADNVETMRDYIIRRLQSEKEAWDKNSELITAMSHDIRTPLTSLMGYLDIIKSGKYETEEEGIRYLDACQEKALQLKDLSDKLFQYFLVFGSQAADKNLEIFDAGILLHQLISEHSAELINYGFTIDFEYTVPEGEEIRADISGMRRLFDNLFSNIMKYAEKDSPVRISAVMDQEEDIIVVRIINSILTESRKVESNLIGLKTCDKICQNMGGTFSYKDEGQLFTVRLTMPIYHGTEGEEENVLEGLQGIDIHNIDMQALESSQNQDAGKEAEEVAEAPESVESDGETSMEDAEEGTSQHE